MNWLRNIFKKKEIISGREEKGEMHSIDVKKDTNFEPQKGKTLEKNAQINPIVERSGKSEINERQQEKSPNVIAAEMLKACLPKKEFEELNNCEISIIENVILIMPYQIRITCLVVNRRTEGDILVATFKFVTQVNGGKKMVEQVPGFAKIPFEVYMRGADNFVNGFLTTFLSAYFGIHDPKFSLKNKLGEEWHSTMGNFQVQGAFNDIDIEQSHLIEILYPKFKEFEVNLEDEYYAVKIYLSRMNGTQFNGDVKIDDVDWDIGLNELLHKDYDHWIKTDQFLAKKQWIILKKCRKEVE